MDCLHLSHRNNRESIRTYGLKPTYMKFDFQREYFNYMGFEDHILFTWLDYPDKNFKFIKDLIYCKNWLHPRNEWAESLPEEEFHRIGGMEAYPEDYFIPEKEGIFDVYMGEMGFHKELTKKQLHGQFASSDPLITSYGFDPEYEHDDKILIVTDNVVDHFKIIESVHYEIDKRGKYRFKYIGVAA